MDAGRVPDHLAERLAAQDWRAIRRQTMAFAVYVSKSVETANELVQEAMTRAMDPDQDLWDPDFEPQLAKHLMRIIENIHRVDRDKREIRRAPINVRAIRENLTPVIPSPERALLDAEKEAEGRACVEDLKRHVAANWLDVELIELSDQGIDKPARQAEILKQSIEDIRNARKRIDRAIDAVLLQRRDASADDSRRRLMP